MRKIVGALFAVALVAGALWLASTCSPEGRSSPGASAGAQADAARVPAKRARSEPEPVPVEVPPVLPAPVDLAQCDRDLDLFGVVVDSDGNAVPGAEVTALRRASTLLQVSAGDRFRHAAGPSARTAADGTFALRLARAETVDLRAAAPGFAPGFVALCAAGEQVRVTLRPAAVLEIAVRDAGGDPVAGAHVMVFTVPTDGTVMWDGRELTTDATGQVVLDDRNPGLYRAGATHTELGSGHGEALVPARGRGRLVITLGDGLTVRGRVVDDATGAPVAGARVSEGGSDLRVVTTGPDGAFEFRGCLRSGRLAFTATADGYASANREVVPGPLELRLGRGDVVTGRIVDTSGRPVAGASLAIFSEGSAIGGNWEQAYLTTAPDGTFTTGVLRRDLVHGLRIEAPGRGRSLVEFGPRPEGPGTHDLGDLVVADGRVVEGTMVDGDGHPVPRSQVILVGVDDGLTRLRPGEAGRVVPSIAMSVVARTDDLGRFRFADVAPGTWAVEVFENGVMISDCHVRLGSGADATGVVLRLPGAGTIAVRVIDPDGRPVPGASLVCSANGWFRNAIAGIDGRLLFRGLPREPVRVMAAPGGGSPAFADSWAGPFPPDGREVEVRLVPTDDIRGVVRDEGGRPVTGLLVWFEGPTGTNRNSARTAADGGFLLRAPRGEPVRIRTNGSRELDDGSFVITPLRIDANSAVPPASLDLVARGADALRSIAVTVLDPDGRLVTGCRVKVGVDGFEGRTGDDGRVVADGLPSGDVTVWAFAEAPGLAADIMGTLSLVRESESEVVVRLRRARTVAGIVVDGDGRPIGGARVRIFAGGFEPRHTQSGDDGRFTAYAPGDEQVLVTAEITRSDGVVLSGDAPTRRSAAETRVVVVPKLH